MTDEERLAIRQGTDLRELVAEDADVVRRGPIGWSLCPFHSDRHPSLAVERDHYHCYACGAHGDALDYVMAVRGLSFTEATEYLASRAGIELSRRTPDRAREDARRRTRMAAEAMSGLSHKRLVQEEGEGVAHAREWLDRMGIGDETRERWSIGYLPESLAGTGDHPTRDLPGVTALAGCVTFPIADAIGRTVGIAGVTPETPSRGALAGLPSLTERVIVAKPCDIGLPYVREALAGVPQAREAIRRTGEAVVTLAPPQAASLHDMGATHAVSTMGGGLSVSQASRLARLGAVRVTLLFPQSTTGRIAARASLPAATQSGADVMWATPPSGGIRALRRLGIDALCATVAHAPWLVDAVVGEIAESACLEDPDALLEAIRQACATLRCAVGDVWQACACATSVARAFGICSLEMLYGALLDGSALGSESWEDRWDRETDH